MNILHTDPVRAKWTIAHNYLSWTQSITYIRIMWLNLMKKFRNPPVYKTGL